MLDLSIIILSFNTRDITLDCLKSIFENKSKYKFDVVVVDNGSTDETLDEIQSKFPKVKIIKNEDNLGFVKANNQALKKTDSKYYLLLNSDTVIPSNTINILIDNILKNNYTILAPKLINKNGSFQSSFGDLPTPIPLFFWISGLDDIFSKIGFSVPSYHQQKLTDKIKTKEVGWVAFTAVVIKKEVIEKIGLLDEKIFMYAEDVEYCFRATNAGYKIGYTDDVEITHLGGASSKFPKLAQWLGEFRGLLYIYKKYYGEFLSLILKLFFWIFITLRIIIFSLLGKFEFSKTYAKILIKI